MRLSEDVVTNFKAMASDAGVPHQSFINLYLRDCRAQNRKVQITMILNFNEAIKRNLEGGGGGGVLKQKQLQTLTGFTNHNTNSIWMFLDWGGVTYFINTPVAKKFIDPPPH